MTEDSNSLLRRASVTTVLATIVRRGPMSRLALAERTGLTQPSVTKATRRLIDAGYLVDDEPTASSEKVSGRMGRPTRMLRLQPERELFAGLNITADELITTVVDLEGTTLTSLRSPCNGRDPGQTLMTLDKVITELRDSLGPRGDRLQSLCVALSGEVDRRQGVARYSPFIGWRDIDVAGPVQRSTGLRTVLDNDVHALTLAELWSGAGLGAESLAMVTIGPGIGCGVVVHDKIIRGAFDVAGELGHIPVDRDGPQCRCGRHGCLETVAATQSIMDQVMADANRNDLTWAELVELAATGDPVTLRALRRSGEALGRGIATLTNLIGLQRIIVSPTYEQAVFDPVEKALRQSLAEHCFGAAGRAELVIKPTGFADWSRAAAVAAIEDRFGAST